MITININSIIFYRIECAVTDSYDRLQSCYLSLTFNKKRLTTGIRCTALESILYFRCACPKLDMALPLQVQYLQLVFPPFDYHLTTIILQSLFQKCFCVVFKQLSHYFFLSSNYTLEIFSRLLQNSFIIIIQTQNMFTFCYVNHKGSPIIDVRGRRFRRGVFF